MRSGILAATRGVAVLVLLVGLADRAGAGPLNPLDFPLSGSGEFPTAAGTFIFDTAASTLTGPGITTPIRGTSLPGFPGVAVFDFNAITVGSDQVFVGRVPRNTVVPSLALLSRGDVTVNGMISVSGSPGVPGSPGAGGGPGGQILQSPPAPGVGVGGGGGGAGFTIRLYGGGGGGGGGFGGGGGDAGPPTSSAPPSIISGSGGFGGGNLANSLQGGSGGGSGNGGRPTLGSTSASNYGGGGGGAIEIGALSGITIGGMGIRANGGDGDSNSHGSAFSGPGGGGGSGGGIFLHGDSVRLLSVLSARGGSGGSGSFFSSPDFGISGSFGGGGGGGGGVVLIQSGAGGFSDAGLIDVSGGSGGIGYNSPSGSPSDGAPGSPGVITLVPEPASLVLVGIGLLGVLGYARHAGRAGGWGLLAHSGSRGSVS